MKKIMVDLSAREVIALLGHEKTPKSLEKKIIRELKRTPLYPRAHIASALARVKDKKETYEHP